MLSFEHGQEGVGQLRHGGVGFAHTIPGRPRLEAIEGEESALIQLQELAITIRYQLTVVGPVASPQEMSRTLLEHHMLGRQRGSVRVQDVPTAKLKGWGMGGGAKAFFSLREGTAQGVSSELALQAVRGSMGLLVSCLFHADNLDWIQWAVFESAVFHRLAWGDVEVSEEPFWPQSPFLGSGLSAALLPESQHLVEQVAADVMMMSGLENTSDTFRELRRRLRVCIIDQRPPGHVISTRVRDGLRQFLTRQVSNPLLVRHIHEQLARVQTAHDLRGMSILFERAIEQLLRWRKGLA
jgi:hypothetical protein